ncbi:MAG: hypothetical protein J7M10_03815, partial [Candidatus Cloacimonetes bacterium]|nr:hypothetical protein [Candidatus Cloacimonadota bacterium]
MKKNIIIFGLMLLSSLSLLYSATIIVDINGTGNYTSIQQGINNSVNGDTVLVYPGTYFENINYNGKNITVSSLYLTTHADSFINKTIIDGNQNGSVVTFSNGEDSTAVIYGLTIVNGTGTIDFMQELLGGGIFCKNASPLINFCIIYNNSSYKGGGIYFRLSNSSLCNTIIKNNNGGGVFCRRDSFIELCNNTIIHNHSYYGGGGITFESGSSAIFDELQRCNIYCNFAGHSNDIYASSDCILSEIILDTATVLNNTKDFIYCNNSQQPSIDILHSKITPVNRDLYVSADGDDNNSGLTQDDPLRTISWALFKVASDSTHPNAIHLENGIYSDELTEEKFPLNMRSYVSLIGESEGGSILDGNASTGLITCIFSDNNLKISKLVLTNGKQQSGSMYISNNCFRIVTENVIIKNNITDYGGGIYCFDSYFTYFYNLNICDNYSNFGGGAYFNNSDPILFNCNISNNTGLDPYSGTGGLVCLDTRLVNCSLYNNNGQQYGAINFIGGTNYLINSTISEHSNPQGAIHVSDNQFLELINCILWNDGNEIYYGSGGQSYVELSYTDIMNGENGIHTNGNGTYNWGDGNIDEDPLFVGGDPFSYELTKYSPCIDAGTPDTTGLHLPATDLAGNPRIYNG